jgi:hypothetical protein
LFLIQALIASIAPALIPGLGLALTCVNKSEVLNGALMKFADHLLETQLMTANGGGFN